MGAESPTVSVVMPAHNAEAFLAEAIESVLCQTFADLELIVVDDESTDSTASIVHAFADERICYLRTARRSGPGAARNVALHVARGAYVAFLDADDLAYPTRLATQLAFVQARPEIALVGPSGSTIATFATPSGTASVRLKMLFDNVIATSLAFARRDALREVGPFDESLPVCEDYELWGRIACRYPIARLPAVLGAHREHPGSTYAAEGDAGAAAVRVRVVQNVLDLALGIQVSPGTALVLGSASSSSEYGLEDCREALAVLELLPRGLLESWADGAADRRALARVWIDKHATVVSREPQLKGRALRTVVRELARRPARGAWDSAVLISLLRLALVRREP